MTSKVDYLKRYSKGLKKKKKRTGKNSNISIIDDDINWKSDDTIRSEVDDSDDDAPLIAEVRDDSVLKWQPLLVEDKTPCPDTSPPRKKKAFMRDLNTKSEDLSPPRRVHDDLSPPRIRSSKTSKEDNKSEEEKNYGRIRGHSSTPARTIRKDSKSQIRTKDYKNSQSPPREQDGLNPPRGINRTRPCEIPKDPTPRVVNKIQNQDPKEHEDTTHVKTVYRDRTGKKVEVDYKKEGKLVEESINDEKFMEWGRGVTQTKTIGEKIIDDAYEMSKPLARYVDDEDLEKMLKERIREGDPMLKFMKKKRPTTSVKTTKGKPQYKGSSAPNRFGIRPGYRWDGVNRSNGFEKSWFGQVSNKRAIAEESYKWSVEDM